MRKLFKKSLAVIMVVVMTLTAAPLSGFVGVDFSGLFKLDAQAADYNATAAIDYANAHWNDGVGLCAEFVSKCLNAGGISIPNKAYYSSSTQSYQNNSGTLGSYTNPYTCSASLLLYLSTKYVVISNPTNSQIAVGDIVFMYSMSNGELRWKDGHVGICIKNNGTAIYAAHNKATNTGTFSSGYPCTYVVKMNGHVHDYVAEGYEQLHPHKVFRKCSCGDWYYTGETKKLSTCTTCYPTVQHNTKIQAWISGSKMGSVPNKFTVGSQYYLCFKLYDDNTGDLYNTYSSSSYTAKMTIKNPDGKVANTYSYKNSDYNWIGYTVDDVGTYTGKIEISGDIEGSVDVSFYVQSNGTVTLTPATLNLNLATQKTGVVEYDLSSYGWPTGAGYQFVYDSDYISYSRSGTEITITAKKTGTTSFSLIIYDKDGEELTRATTKVVITAPTYTISYNANGGSGAPSSQTKTYGKDLTLSTTKPTRSGYTFLGWSTSSTATTATYSAGGKYTSNSKATLYAVWKANTYTVKYNANGGSGTMSNSSHTYDISKALTSNAFTRSGYTFLGWATSSSATNATYTNGQSIKNLTVINSATVNLYAVWSKLPTYTIGYNANGGSGAPSSQTKTKDVTLTLSTTKPTRTGYTFLGWSTSSTATTATYSAGGKYTSNSKATLYAVWKANTYTVKYNANGGSGSMSNASHTYDASKALTSNAFTRNGYTFLGWSTSSSAATAIYTNGQSVKNLTSTNGATVNLYAVWSKISAYKISYNANGGSGAPSSQTKTHDKDLTLSTTKPTRSGYTFLGWSTSSTATTATYSAGGKYTANSNATLYAVWKKNATVTYTLTYNANGGSGAPSSQSGSESYTISETRPTRSGYTFFGWSESSTATSASYWVGDIITISNDTTLYAVWKLNRYIVSYNANGGSGAPSSQTKNYGKDLTLSTMEPTRSGYTFLGWATNSTATIAAYSAGGKYIENKNTTLYAVWQKNVVEPTPVELPEIAIKRTTKTTINFGDTLVLKLEEIEIPEGYAFEWFVEGAGVSTWVSEDGLECRVTSIANGNPTIYAKLVDEEENPVINADGEEIFDEITLVSKAGFWQKFISFFKNLFGINRVIY